MLTHASKFWKILRLTCLLLFCAGGSMAQMVCEPWPAMDGLGRELPGFDECGPPREGKFVGIFYFLWLGHHGQAGPHNIRAQGGRTPQVSFLFNSRAQKTTEKVYNEFYAKNLYPELWFRWKGKPLLMTIPDDLSERIQMDRQYAGTAEDSRLRRSRRCRSQWTLPLLLWEMNIQQPTQLRWGVGSGGGPPRSKGHEIVWGRSVRD